MYRGERLGPHAVAPFSNHTPRLFEVQAAHKSITGPTMTNPDETATESGIHCLSAQHHPAIARKDLSTFHVVQLEDEKCYLRPSENCTSLFSLPANSLQQSPIPLDKDSDDEKMTHTNLFALPPSNPSYQMSYFLRTTGPAENVHANPGQSKRSVHISRTALRFFGFKEKTSSEPLAVAHDKYVKYHAIHRSFY